MVRNMATTQLIMQMQAQRLLDAIESKATVDDIDVDSLLDWDEDADALEEIVRPYHEQAIKLAYNQAEGTLNTGRLVYNVKNPHIQEVLGRLAKQVRDVSDTTKQEIRDMVGRAADEGISAQELGRRLRALTEVQGEDDSHTRKRAQLIATTELASAHTLGSIAAYEEAGVVDKVEFLAEEDACPICSRYDGDTATLGEGFGDYGFPPLHPGCRCAVAPVI